MLLYVIQVKMQYSLYATNHSFNTFFSRGPARSESEWFILHFHNGYLIYLDNTGLLRFLIFLLITNNSQSFVSHRLGFQKFP